MENNTLVAIKDLEKKYNDCQIDKPLRVERYDAGDQVLYNVALVTPPYHRNTVQVRLLIEKFIGGGFAGQVYKARILSVEGGESPFVIDRSYALKIFIPPSRDSLFFRNLLYGIGFQGAFQIQSNPFAARAGALWQKFIRRAAASRFHDDDAVNDIYGTLIDHTLGSCGEISNWIDGRTWRLEVDDHLDMLALWEKGEEVPQDLLGSPEYRAKKTFLRDFVKLLHDLGAHEFARQYEWSTWKSQPNALKRLATEAEPDRGLTAVDFRAGLTLLPFLPMSPGDVKLIFQGFKRGSLVQFDRGDVNQLERFVNSHPKDFEDLFPLLDELKACETIYRNSIPDITHNHVRLLYDKSLHSTIFKSTINGWRLKNKVDQAAEEKLQKNKLFFIFFLLLGFLPFIGSFIRNFIGRQDYRSYYSKLLSDASYLKRALLANRIENLIRWNRAERVTPEITQKIYGSLPLYLYHLVLSVFPDQAHRILSDRQYLIDFVYNVMIKPFRLYLNKELREEWLKEMVQEGERAQIISKNDADKILSQIHEPYIHRYLQSLAVHIVMSPVTRVISLAIAIIFLLSHPEMSRLEAFAIAAGIIALFQIIPISPGSLARGLYILFVVIKERNVKDYSLALPLSFFKYIGYFSLPIQMAYRYPTLARCMVGFWTTKLVGVVPVFGEKGALLEQKFFTFSYNWPLTIRRKFWYRRDVRELQKTRIWHVLPIIILFGVLYGIAEYLYITSTGNFPSLLFIIPILTIFGFLSGVLINMGSGGASSLKRVLFAVIGGIGIGILTSAIPYLIRPGMIISAEWIASLAWNSFVTAVLGAMGAVLSEFKV